MIGLIAHVDKPEAAALVARITEELDDRGAAFEFESKTAALIGRKSDLDERALASMCDLIVVMGGDGTLLRAVHQMGGHLKPVFGINIGSLGFLTCLGSQEYKHAVDSIVRKDYVLSNRSLLEVSLAGRTEKKSFLGLNDIVVSRGERSQLVKLRVLIDGVPLTDFNADGLIISTPTGSTAYSLSAGGPILMPDSGVVVITPICPHVLSNRSVVVSDRSVIEVRLQNPSQEVFVTVDGLDVQEMHFADVLHIEKAEAVLPLAMLPDRSFSEVLRQKLKWTGTNV